MSDKSVLDNIPVDDKQYKEHMKKWTREEQKPQMTIVSTCPTCGSPIYGHQIIANNEEPEVKRSCRCAGVLSTIDVIGTNKTT
jgi:hypothetical protein